MLAKRLSRNTAILLVSNTGSAFLSFLLSVIIGRAIGDVGLGIYAASLAWIYPLSLVSEFGIGTLITREVAQLPDEAHAYLKSSVFVRLLIGSVITILSLVFAPFLAQSPNVVTGVRLSAPLILILPLVGSFTAIFRAREMMQPVAVLNLGMLIAQVSLTSWAFYRGYGVNLILIINVLTSLGQLFAAWWIYRLYFYQPIKTHILSRQLIKQAYPFAIAAVLAAIQSRLNILILERTNTAAQVGLYAAAFRFIEAGRLIPHAFFDALFPHLSAMAKDRKELDKRFKQITLGLIVFGVVFALSINLLSQPIISFIYGDKFVNAVPILNLAAVGLLFLLLKGGRTLYWYAQGHEQFVNQRTLAVIVIQALLALSVIPKYGAVGAAFVFVSSEAIAFVLLLRR